MNNIETVTIDRYCVDAIEDYHEYINEYCVESFDQIKDLGMDETIYILQPNIIDDLIIDNFEIIPYKCLGLYVYDKNKVVVENPNITNMGDAQRMHIFIDENFLKHNQVFLSSGNIEKDEMFLKMQIEENMVNYISKSINISSQVNEFYNS